MTDKGLLTAAVITLGCTTAASILPKSIGGKEELPNPRLWIGTGLTFFGLAAMRDAAPQLSGYLATAVALTAFVAYGSPLLANWFAGNNTQPVGKPTQG